MRLTGLLVYIQVIPAGITLELEAMSHMGRKHGASNRRNTIWTENYVINNERHPLLVPELIQMEMAVTDQGLEHLLMNPSLYLHSWIRMSNITGRIIKAWPLGVRGMMRWVRLCVRFLNHHLHVGLIRLNSLVGLHNPLLLFIMGGLTQ